MSLTKANKLLGLFYEKPEDSFLHPHDAVYAKLSKASKLIFDFSTKADREGFLEGPLKTLLVDGFEAEQIWQQIQLQNEHLIEQLDNKVERFLELEEDEDNDEDDLEEGFEGDEADTAGMGSDEFENDDGEVGNNDDDIDDDDNDEDEDAEEDETGMGGSDDEDDEDEGDNVDESGEDSKEESGQGGGRKGSAPPGMSEEDMFFNMGEMEKFADGEIIEEDEEDEEMDALYGDVDAEDEGDEGGAANHDEFFGTGNMPKDDIAVADRDELQSDEEEDTMTAFERKTSKMKKQISVIEAQLIKPRSWDLGGEVDAYKRPKDSLLHTSVDFDTAQRPDEELTEERNLTLEDMIKQRIIDEAWDDPEREVETKEKIYKPTEEVSADKSSLGLADVYEREYMELAKGDKEPSAAEEKLNAEHQEVAVLFAKLSHKLDALSDFNFTPKLHTDEVTVVSNTPAIQMEEIIPMGVSEAVQTAPHEEYSAKNKGAPVGVSEMKSEEKKARRRSRKRAYKKKNSTDSQQTKDNKAVSHAFNQRFVKIDKGEDDTKYGGSGTFAKIKMQQNESKVQFAPVAPTQDGHKFKL